MIIGYSRTSTTIATDPNFSSVVLLMGFENGVVDESPSAHGAATGSASASTSQLKYGSHSLACLGNSIRYPDHSDWDLGSGQFTIEAFVRQTGDSNGTIHYIVGQYFSSTGTDEAWMLLINSSDHLEWRVSTTGSDHLTDIIGATTLSVNTWYHVCVDYDGVKYRMYVNGVMDGSSTTARTIHNSVVSLSIGANSNSGIAWFDGYIDEVRITKGVARYANDSGFAAPTAAFPRSGNWTDTASISPSGQASDYNGYTLRQVYSGSMLSTSGSLVRLQLQAGTSGGFSIDALYIGQQAASGDPYDMMASGPAPAQLLVNGAGSFSVTAGRTVFTDPLRFAIDHTKTYVISAHFNASSALATASGTSVAAYQKAAASEAATADVTGYTVQIAGQALLVTKIQVTP